MIDLDRIASQRLEHTPYEWAEIGDLFSQQDAAALAASYPHDHFKTVASYGGEKDYEYEARAFISMGSQTVSHPRTLGEAWLRLAHDLCSPRYCDAMSQLTGLDLTALPMEVNVFHFGPGACLGPHVDLAEKLVTHVLYFNMQWNEQDGGCLNILNSANPGDLAREIRPIVGNSVVLVRSEKSWHAVTPVAKGCLSSRRSMTVTYYRPGAVSSMWPEDDTSTLHDYRQPAEG